MSAHQLTIEPLGDTIEVEEGQTILDACLRAGCELVADLRQFDEYDVAQFLLRVVSDADGADVTLNFDPLVVFRVAIISRVHSSPIGCEIAITDAYKMATERCVRQLPAHECRSPNACLRSLIPAGHMPCRCSSSALETGSRW